MFSHFSIRDKPKAGAKGKKSNSTPVPATSDPPVENGSPSVAAPTDKEGEKETEKEADKEADAPAAPAAPVAATPKPARKKTPKKNKPAPPDAATSKPANEESPEKDTSKENGDATKDTPTANDKKIKRHQLTVMERRQIQEMMTNGTRPTEISKSANLSKSTLYSLKSRMKKSADRPDTKNMFRDREAENPQLEKALYQWFKGKQETGANISGNLLKNQALYFNEKIGRNPDFRASNGWLVRFKERYDIVLFNVRGKKLPDLPEVAKFHQEFKTLLSTNHYIHDYVYNANETALYFNALPTPAPGGNKKAPRVQVLQKNRITMMVSSNILGSHQVKLTVLGDCKKLLSDQKYITGFQDKVKYYYKEDARMDSYIYDNWVRTVFAPEICDLQYESGQFGDVLLLVDSAPSHVAIPDFQHRNINFRVTHIAPNIASLIQPVQQGIIPTFKRNYRQVFINQLFAITSNTNNLTKNQSKFPLVDAIPLLYHCWMQISKPTLKFGWKRLLEGRGSDITDLNPLEAELVALKACPGFENVDIQDVLHLEQEEHEEYTFEYPTADQILDEILGRNPPPEEPKPKKSRLELSLKRGLEGLLYVSNNRPEGKLEIHDWLVNQYEGIKKTKIGPGSSQNLEPSTIK